MKEENNKDNNSRRNFLKLGLLAGAGTVATGAILSGTKSKAEESGEKIKVLTTSGAVMEVDKNYLELAPVGIKESHEGIPGRKFVMVIDLAKCKNARKCVEACQYGHSLSKDQEFLKVYLLQDSEKTAPYWFPKPCFHCDNPQCVSVCPVGATYKRTDGIVLIDNDRCIGCKFCMTGCPYSARIFSWKEEENNPDQPYSPEKGVPKVEGTVSKCDFCPDLAREGKLPYCVSACPMGVIYYGDIDEDVVTNGADTFRFSELIRDRAGYKYLENLGTRPNVYYLPPVDRQFPVERGLEGLEDDIKARYSETPFVQKLNNKETK
jgi:molybdopterin-containing oxidoreductase family iron-sulfur binding subunit